MAQGGTARTGSGFFGIYLRSLLVLIVAPAAQSRTLPMTLDGQETRVDVTAPATRARVSFRGAVILAHGFTRTADDGGPCGALAGTVTGWSCPTCRTSWTRATTPSPCANSCSSCSRAGPAPARSLRARGVLGRRPVRLACRRCAGRRGVCRPRSVRSARVASASRLHASSAIPAFLLRGPARAATRIRSRSPG